MGYKSLIDRQLSLAFNKLKDLAIDIIPIKKSLDDFDFETQTVDSTETTLTTIKAVWLGASKKSDKTNKVRRSLMFKRASIGETSLYDSFDESGVIWTVVRPIKDNGYITVLELEGELNG